MHTSRRTSYLLFFRAVYGNITEGCFRLLQTFFQLYISVPDITEFNTEMNVSRGECIAPLLRILVFPGSNFD